MWSYNYTNELYHHGIKGMKWGVRRYQNENGTLTPEGKKRYSENEKEKTNIIERHKEKLINDYVKKGYSKHNAEIAAKQRMKVEFFLGATATIAVGVLAKKAITRIGQDYVDQTIKSGKIVQNIGVYKDSNFTDRPFYGAITEHDKKAYGSMFPAEKKWMQTLNISPTAKHLWPNPNYEGVFKSEIKILEPIKRASTRKAQKIFEEKMKADPVFRANVIDAMKKTTYQDGLMQYLADYKKTGGKVSRRFYDSFNRALATKEVQSVGLHRDFYDSLKSHGYNALLDINDARYSGYKGIARSPTIFFGDKWKKIAVTKISDLDINKNNVNYRKKLMAKQMIKTYGGYAIAGYTGKTVMDYALINKYLKEHPNSKLSDKEIMELYNK